MMKNNGPLRHGPWGGIRPVAEPNANPAVEPNGLKFATRDLPTLQAVQDLQESDALPAPLLHPVLQLSTRAGKQRRADVAVGILIDDQVIGLRRSLGPCHLESVKIRGARKFESLKCLLV